LVDLELKIDKDSNYGLAFNLKDKAVPIYAPVLNGIFGSCRFDSYNIDESTGLPRTLEKGSRYLYTRNFGLSRVCLLKLNLKSDNDELDSSRVEGRIIVVSKEY